MPLQNRVTPFSELVAEPGRGLVYGNRGCLHDDARRIRRRYNGRRWIACRLRFRGWHRHPLLQPGRFTELFFLDEATAFAAGHRPCALCRREDYNRFAEIWRRLHPGQAGADAMDAQLHAERVEPVTRAEPPGGARPQPHHDAPSQRHHDARFEDLPDGAFVIYDEEPCLLLGAALLRWTAAGYEPGGRRPACGRALLITPPSLVAVLRTGWAGVVPLIHQSASAV